MIDIKRLLTNRKPVFYLFLELSFALLLIAILVFLLFL